jgi:hypothetical protein
MPVYLQPKWNREVAQAGSAPGLGPGGRRFESCLPDSNVYQKTLNARKSTICGFFYSHFISKKYKENQIAGELKGELKMQARLD